MLGTGSGMLGASIARAAQTSSSQIRVGQVLDYDQGSVTVRLAGDAVADFPYLRSYQPLVGEMVLLAANGSAWIVIDGLAGMPPENPVVNAGFEDATTSPWGKVDLAGATTLGQTEPDPAIEGATCAYLTSNTLATDTVVYSGPIAVTPGDRWTADCAVRTEGSGLGASSTSAELMLTWYANDTNVYPTTSASDSSISVQALTSPMPYWTLLRRPPRPSGAPLGWVPTVPAAGGFMRVAVRFGGSGSPLASDFLLDRVVARQIS